jgi:antiviral helicase SKI2
MNGFISFFFQDSIQGVAWSDPFKDFNMREISLVDRWRSFQTILPSASAIRCHECPSFPAHFAQYFESRRLEADKEAMERRMSEESLLVYPEYKAKLNVLIELGYLNRRQEVKLKGRVACAMFQHELMLTEILFENVLMDFHPAEIAALLSCLVFQGKSDEGDLVFPPQLEAGEISSALKYSKFYFSVCDLSL